MSALRIVALVGLGFVATFGILLGWIALVYFANTYTAIPLTAEEALNLILVAFVAAVGLPLLHAAAYRWFWHIRRNQAAGRFSPGLDMPAFGSEPTQPAPRVRRSARQLSVYALLYVIGFSSLVAAYAPLGRQQALVEFLWRFSAGRASFSILVQIVIVYLPMALTFACLVPVFERDQKRIGAGGLTEDEALGIQDRQAWLSSFATAFVMAGFLSVVAGNLILGHL